MKIWIATGGTGGHVFPAMAVAQELAARGHNITISCDGRTDKMVRDSSPQGSHFAHIWASGVGAKSKLKQMLFCFFFVFFFVFFNDLTQIIFNYTFCTKT